MSKFKLLRENSKTFLFYEDQLKALEKLEKETGRSGAYIIRQMLTYCLKNNPVEIINDSSNNFSISKNLGDINE